MIRLGKLALDGSPRVAVSFTDGDGEAVIETAVRGGVDIAELRVDQFGSQDRAKVLEAAGRFAVLPTIATVRHQEEGGGWSGAEAERIDLYRALLPAVDAIDVELRFPETIEALLPDVRGGGKVLIASHHDFEATPSLEAIGDIIGRAQGLGADIVKVAAQVRSSADVRVLAQALIEHGSQNLIVIGMGPEGLVTRALFPALGSLLTFAANGARQSAPGQAPYGQMIELLRTLYPTYAAQKAELRNRR